jgi:hypothetical protein
MMAQPASNPPIRISCWAELMAPDPHVRVHLAHARGGAVLIDEDAGTGHSLGAPNGLDCAMMWTVADEIPAFCAARVPADPYNILTDIQPATDLPRKRATEKNLWIRSARARAPVDEHLRRGPSANPSRQHRRPGHATAALRHTGTSARVQSSGFPTAATEKESGSHEIA